jgi:hypothetical protein
MTTYPRLRRLFLKMMANLSDRRLSNLFMTEPK